MEGDIHARAGGWGHSPDDNCGKTFLTALLILLSFSLFHNSLSTAGDVVTCVLDLTEATASFYLNGELMGEPLSDIDLSHRWFPAASLTGGQQLQFFLSGPAPGSQWQPEWQSMASGKLHSRDAQDHRLNEPAGALARSAPALPLLPSTALSALPSLREADLCLYAEATLASLGLGGGWLGLVVALPDPQPQPQTATQGRGGVGISWGFGRPAGTDFPENELVFGHQAIGVPPKGAASVIGVGLTPAGVVFATVDGEMQGA